MTVSVRRFNFDNCDLFEFVFNVLDCLQLVLRSLRKMFSFNFNVEGESNGKQKSQTENGKSSRVGMRNNTVLLK